MKLTKKQLKKLEEINQKYINSIASEVQNVREASSDDVYAWCDDLRTAADRLTLIADEILEKE